MRVGVVIATIGRREMIAALMDLYQAQTVLPSAMVYSATDSSDLPPPDQLPPFAETVFGPKGLCAQRNRGLKQVIDRCDVIAFLDDDYLPSQRAIEGIGDFFSQNKDVAGINGRLLFDGVKSADISVADARAVLASYDSEAPEPVRITGSAVGLYGCNMAFRADHIRDLMFDENLPLYGWQEDIDFSVQAGLRGRTVRTNAFAGIHLGIKSSRLSGVRLGYSQVVNPFYLVRKGTMSAKYAAKIVFKNIIANSYKSLKPEPWIDRAGRLKGNAMGVLDVMRGRWDPKRILEME